MRQSKQSFSALMRLAELLPKQPGIMMLLGYLAGQLERVRFTRPQEIHAEPDVLISLTTPQAPLWTGRWLQARVEGMTIADPTWLMAALNQRDDDIWVSVDFGSFIPEWYLAVVDAPDIDAQTTDDQLAVLKARVDQTLDIYNAVRQQLSDGDPAREKELAFILETAQNEVQRLSREIERLQNQSLKQNDS